MDRIYKVFSQKGLDLKGYIYADIAFKGSQEDAVNGRYKTLQNSGKLELRNIRATSEYLPKPFLINKGIFVFNQDKMNFSFFTATYGQSDFKMYGHLKNVIDYALTDNSVLKGVFVLRSDYINVDEFMSNANAPKVSDEKEIEGKPVVASGVVVIPPNFDIEFDGTANKVNFEDL